MSKRYDFPKFEHYWHDIILLEEERGTERAKCTESYNKGESRGYTPMESKCIKAADEFYDTQRKRLYADLISGRRIRASETIERKRIGF